MTVHMQFFGDLSLNGAYNDPQQHRPLYENMQWLTEQIGKADFRVVNWESPLWGNGGINELKSPRLATTEETARQILILKLNLATLANNHFYDCREEGFCNTINFLQKNKITTIGIGKTAHESRLPLIQNINGVQFAFLNYLGYETNPNIPDGAAVFANKLIPENVDKDIKKYRVECDHVIVMPHWGTHERVQYPEVWQRTMARHWIEEGASLVMGTHAHCIQGWERYQNGAIIYSLGDFLFSPVTKPGFYSSLHDSLSNKIAILQIVFEKNSIKSIDFDFFDREFESLLLQSGNKKIRQKHLKYLSSFLIVSDKKLKRKLSCDIIFKQFRKICCLLGIKQILKTISFCIKKTIWRTA